MKKLKKKTTCVSIMLVLIVIGISEVIILWHKTGDLQHTSKDTAGSTPSSISGSSNPAFNKNLYSIDKSDSLWVVVNKGRVLPSTYFPSNLVTPKVPLRLGASSTEMQLRTEAAQSLEQMFSAARKDGINLMLDSGYRSYANQVATYNGFVRQDGQVAADRYSARPGHSEHQTGLAADIEPTSRKCELQVCFGDLAEGKWLESNAYKFGFIIRYQKNTENLTGYQYEPWHVRYVGSELALEVSRAGQTLEQYFNLPLYLNYPSQMLQLG